MNKEFLKKAFVCLQRYPNVGTDCIYHNGKLHICIFQLLPLKYDIDEFINKNGYMYISMIKKEMNICFKLGRLDLHSLFFHIKKQDKTMPVTALPSGNELEVVFYLCNTMNGEIIAEKSVKANKDFSNLFYENVKNQMTDNNLFIHDSNCEALSKVYSIYDITKFMITDSFFFI